jgi:hypothetical protein
MSALSVALAFSLLAQAQQGPDSAVVVAKAAIKPLVDSVALRDAGFFPIGFGAGTRDLTPFQGQHWISLGRFANNQPVSLERPTFMMYLPVNDSLVPIGVAYSRRVARDSAAAPELAGKPVEWHDHIFCRAIPGEGQVLADGVEDCKVRGGTPAPNRINMVHVWTVPNPDGPYAHDNPALPFMATGLTPPPHATRDDRLLGVALGESYGAKLFVAHRIERDAKTAGKEQSLVTRRAALAGLVPQLRAAQRSGNTAKFASVRKQLMDAWNALANEYRALAATPEMKARFDVELEQAVAASAHRHKM